MKRRLFIIMMLLAFVVLVVTYQAVDGKKNVIIPNAALVIASNPPAETPAATDPLPEVDEETPHTPHSMHVVEETQDKTPAPNAVKKETAAASENVAAVDYFNLGISMINEGMYEQAIAAFHQVLLMTPGYGDAHYYLALTHLALGNGNAAFEEYQTLRNIDAALAEDLYKDITDSAMSDRGNKYVMQVGAFKNNEYAEAMIKKLKGRYFHAYIEKTDIYNKVRICGIKSREQGNRMMLDIENEFHIKPYLVKLK